MFGNPRKGGEKQKIPAMMLRHLPKIDGDQAKEEKSVSPPCLELFGFFPGTRLDELEGYRESQGCAAMGGKVPLGIWPWQQPVMAQDRGRISSHIKMTNFQPVASTKR